MSLKVGFNADGNFAIGDTKPMKGITEDDSWMRPPSLAVISSTTTLVTADTIFWTPIFIPLIMGVDMLGFNVTTTATSARIALYDTDGADPNNLLEESGIIDVSTGGTKTYSFSERIIQPGVYWTGINSNNSALAVTAISTTEVTYSLGVNSSSLAATTRRSRSFTFGAFPDPSGATNAGAGSNITLVALRRSS